MRTGLRGQNGPNVLSPVALGPSREAGLVMSPATPAWAPPFRQGLAAWANVIQEVSVPLRSSRVGWMAFHVGVPTTAICWCLEAVASGKVFAKREAFFWVEVVFFCLPSVVETGIGWEDRLGDGPTRGHSLRH